jgi:hypothetical protein
MPTTGVGLMGRKSTTLGDAEAQAGREEAGRTDPTSLT